MTAATMLEPMARKKQPAGGKHVTERTPIQVPTEWLAVARKRAKDRQQPVLWYLIWLIQQDATAQGHEPLPPAPWDK